MAVKQVTEADAVAAVAEIDWDRINGMTDDEIAAAVAADPDAARLHSAEAVFGARVRFIRRRTGLSQAAFAARYGIPVGTLRDWEQGNRLPDAPSRAYVRAIGNAPDAVASAYAA